MAKYPVTRIQIDAYRFGQRRLESALARRDPVLLHEVIRGQRRAVAVGLVLATLVGLGMVGYVKLTGKTDWTAQQIIRATGSGQMYVVIHQPDRLVPVANLVAARLMYRAAANLGTGLVGGADATPSVTTMDDSALVGAERTQPSGLVGAPGASLPASDAAATAAPGAWALCDTGEGTLLVAGVGATRPLGLGDGVLLTDGQRTYLVTGNRKYPIDSPDALAAYDLKFNTPRSVSAGLLGLIPDGPRLQPLTLTGAATSGPASRPRVGQVVRVDRPAQVERFYLIVPGGAVEVSRPVANLFRAGRGDDLSQPADLVTVEAINAMNRVQMPALDAYPQVQPVIEQGRDAAVVCWQWAADGRSGSVTVAPGPPLREGQTITHLAQSDGAGPKLDAVSLPGAAALSAVAVVAGAPQADGYWLVSETGVAYPVQDRETAQALGLRSPVPVPMAALRAMPQGPRLDLAAASRTVGTLTDPAPGSAPNSGPDSVPNS
jgi:type VII secretion protein EccB